MKQVNNISCWTDYPFVELGDLPGKQAPIRQVLVVGFDLNKYAVVLLEDGSYSTVKAGYLYQQPGRCGEVKCVNYRKLERMKGI